MEVHTCTKMEAHSAPKMETLRAKKTFIKLPEAATALEKH